METVKIRYQCRHIFTRPVTQTAPPMYHNPIMKFTALLLLSAIPAAAQTAPAAKPPLHHPAAAGCAKLPELSPKIPALPAGLPCAKHLYTISIHAPASVDYVAPAANSEWLKETLRLQDASSFSLDYIDVKPGTGAPVAPHKSLTVNYTGYLVDGTKFDSSADHPGTPFSFEYGQLGGQHSAVPGWETGFDGMKVGAKRRLFIPYQLAYGPNGKAPTIPAKAELIFDIELVSVADAPPAPKVVAAPPRPHPLTPPNPATPPSTPATPPATTQPPAQPGSAQTVVGQPTTTPPATPAADPTKPTATPPKP
jgi:peptidylprolyl isomerase